MSDFTEGVAVGFFTGAMTFLFGSIAVVLAGGGDRPTTPRRRVLTFSAYDNAAEALLRLTRLGDHATPEAAVNAAVVHYHRLLTLVAQDKTVVVRSPTGEEDVLDVV